MLTSTTAPGKTFTSRSELANHYKSDWHRYNLKRKEAGLTLLTEKEFQARLAAALALKREKEEAAAKAGTSHLKNKKKHPQQQQQEKQENIQKKDSDTKREDEMEEEEEEAPPVIDPRMCIFSNQVFPSVALNVKHMREKFGFFIPEQEYLSDLEGIIGYCHEKVKLGHVCLYCQRVFPTWRGVQQHMIDSRHCKLRYEEGIDIEEYEPFYDFEEANREFLDHFNGGERTEGQEGDVEMEQDEAEYSDGDEDEWEDMDEDDDNDEVSMDGYQAEALKRGFDVTELGELIFPDGRVVGHRALAKYYKQRYSSNHVDSAAVSAYRKSLGIAPGQHLRGRGILVQSRDAAANGAITSRGLSNYTTLSVYRYKAVVKKQRRQDASGYRRFQKYYNRHNRFDKKGNRMMNGVSVAHAKR